MNLQTSRISFDPGQGLVPLIGLSFVVFLGIGIAEAAPEPIGIEGDVSSDSEIEVVGTGFGVKVQAEPIFFDTQDRIWINGNMNRPYADFRHGDVIPTGPAWPWKRSAGGRVELWLDGGYPRYGSTFTDEDKHNAWVGYPGGFPPPESNEVKEVYIRWWWKASFDPNDDTFSPDRSGTSAKFVRIWDTTDHQSFGLEISWTQMHLAGARHRCRVNGDGVADWPSWNDFGGDIGAWNLMELHIDPPDRSVRAWTNGQLIHDVENAEFGSEWDCDRGDAVPNSEFNGIQPRLWGIDGSGRRDWRGQSVEFSDYYADSTPARIEIGNAARWRDVTIREPQIAVTWSDERIRFVLYTGRLGSLVDKFLYVVDKDGRVNQSGLALDPLAPSPPSDFSTR